MNDRLLTVIAVVICSIAGWCLILAAADGMAHLVQWILRAVGA